MAENQQGSARRAIVIGASMAGLLAARALADHYDEVTLLERDTFPRQGEHRKGVPQGKHAHAVLVRGLQVMQQFFPGLVDELVQQGAEFGDICQNALWYHDGHHLQRSMSGLNGICVGRPLLESTVRRSVLSLPNIHAVDGCDVLGLLATEDNRRITGVRIIRRKADSPEETFTADLVVDTTGRGSRSPAWLEALGYGRPAEESVRVNISYLTCEYRRSPEHLPGIYAVVTSASPASPSGSAMLALEGNRWIVTIGTYMSEQVRADHATMLSLARTLPAPEVYHVIKDAEPLGTPVIYKVPSNLWRHYEQMNDFPKGYLVMGDALCSFNPVYAQGMSVAALEALALADCLAHGEERLAERFFNMAAKIVDIPWSVAVTNDLRIPSVAGHRSPKVRFINWYMRKFHAAAHHDASLAVAFLRVANMLAHPSSLLHPAIAWRVLRGSLFRKASQTSARHDPEAILQLPSQHQISSS